MRSAMNRIIRAFEKKSPSAAARMRYLKHRHRIPNLKNPHNLSEFILAQIASGEILNYASYADKVAVRDHLTE